MQIGKVNRATGEREAILPAYPISSPSWTPEIWRDPGANVPNCPAEYVGFAYLPIVEVDAPAIARGQVRGALVSEVVGMIEITRTYAPADRDLDQVKTDLSARVKPEAEDRILAMAPAWRQRNMLRRGIQILEHKGNRPLSAEEEVEEAALRAAGDAVDAIRAASDDAEAAITAAVDLAGAYAVYDAWAAS